MIRPPATVADERLAAYLDEVGAGLPGPRGQRARILAELADGLDEAVADQVAAGLPRRAAAAAAIDEFGTANTVAHAFAGEVSTASARRALGWLVVTGPLVGVWWLFLLHPSRGALGWSRWSLRCRSCHWSSSGSSPPPRPSPPRVG